MSSLDIWAEINTIGYYFTAGPLSTDLPSGPFSQNLPTGQNLVKTGFILLVTYTVDIFHKFIVQVLFLMF